MFPGTFRGVIVEEKTWMRRDRGAAGRAVSAALAARGWTAADLMRETGLDPGTVGDFLAGKRWPQAPTRGRIEKALGWAYGRIQLIAEGLETVDDPAPTSAETPDIVELLENDPTLSAESRSHIVTQYRLLQQLSALEVNADPWEIDRQAIRDSKELTPAQKRAALEAEAEARGRVPEPAPEREDARGHQAR